MSRGLGDVYKRQAQVLCESRGGRPGLPVPNSPYGLCGRTATLNLNLNQMATSTFTHLLSSDLSPLCSTANNKKKNTHLDTPQLNSDITGVRPSVKPGSLFCQTTLFS